MEMSAGKALVILLVVVVVIAAYLGLAHWLGIREYWAGFLFLLQWSVMEQMQVDRLSRSIAGAVLGASIAFVPGWLTPSLGTGAASAVMLGMILLAVFLQIRGKAVFAVNGATMLFLTVMTIPQIAANALPGEIYLGLTAGIVFFGGLASLAAWAKGRGSGRPQASA